ncbi:AraC family transcriptional regulator [Pseudoalteromonas tunicata]|uniref:AraC family transcriptional regulator n=1 Tax=Pseudoalteromonas tunicata TaxID=314281 RepID=UPI00273FC9E2|nr:AraC family transcriptional regulator [Pseudoalteromonas tunicata]MDP4985160.1 AraC family transcriptional regulator [Pseudoalteromonas tunicata]
MTSPVVLAHQARINRVCDFIVQNLNDEHTLERLSQVAALSKYHFHRVFLTSTGLTVIKFVQLARLKRASFRLAFEPEKRVLDIALEAGFDSSEAFSRAFKRTFMQSPSQFRTEPNWPNWHGVFAEVKNQQRLQIPAQLCVEVVDFPKTRVGLIEHRGEPERIFETTAQFINWRKSSGLSPINSSQTFGIVFGDPNATKAADFRFQLAGSVQKMISDNAFGVVNGVIAGCKCAKIIHHGSLDAMEPAIYALYRDWLPSSGYELGEQPLFFEYLNFIHQVDECDLRTYIYLPLS